jgi:hypothetical protein
LDAYLAVFPESAPAHCERARARDLLGRLSEALADYDEAGRLHPPLRETIEPRAAELRKILGK